MERLKKLGYKLLFPHIALLIILIPISIALLIYSMLVLGTTHFVSIISYVLSFYTLTVVCFRIPNIINFVKNGGDGGSWTHVRKGMQGVSTYLVND